MGSKLICWKSTCTEYLSFLFGLIRHRLVRHELISVMSLALITLLVSVRLRLIKPLEETATFCLNSSTSRQVCLTRTAGVWQSRYTPVFWGTHSICGLCFAPCLTLTGYKAPRRRGTELLVDGQNHHQAPCVCLRWRTPTVRGVHLLHVRARSKGSRYSSLSVLSDCVARGHTYHPGCPAHAAAMASSSRCAL